jgi:hypothetical protein
MQDFQYIYQWNRQDRKGQPCRVLERGKMNSCLVEFPDGYRMVTSRLAISLVSRSTPSEARGLTTR